MDAFVLHDQTRLVSIPIEAWAEEDIDFVNEKGLEGLIGHVFEIAKLSVAYDLISLLSDGASVIDDRFAELLHGSIVHFVHYLEVEEKTLEVFIVSSAEVLRIASAIAISAQESKGSWCDRHYERLALTSEDLDKMVRQYWIPLSVAHS